MAFNNGAGRNGSFTPTQQNENLAGTPLGWKELAPARTSPKRKRRRRIIAVLSFLLLITLIFTALRLGTIGSDNNNLLQIHVGNQQAATLDLRQSFPISPYLMGTNVFPPDGSNSLDATSSGFMHYTAQVTGGLQDANFKLLRYPGGEWGEQHILSLTQMNAFSQLLNETHSQGMMQAHLSGPVNGQPKGLLTLHDRANMAGTWVDYMNNPHSYLRQGAHAHDAYHPVNFWTIGNEPDLAKPFNLNPDTGKPYTVDEYIQAFIAFSIEMHKNDPRIMVFGPEISQFYGVGAGPTDANGKLWMDTFLEGIGKYEAAHPNLPYHILDGVSFHRYQFSGNTIAPSMLASSSDEWNYLLPPLRSLIKRDMGRDLPIAITEINSNPTAPDPTHGQSALWWADTMGTLMNQQIAYVGFFSTADVEHPYPLFTQGGQKQTAMLRVMQLFSHLQHNLIPLSIQREPISTYATQDDAHQTVSLMFVNKGQTPQLAEINPVGQFSGSGGWQSQQVSIAGDSIVVLTLHRNGDAATTYSYAVPAADDQTIQPLLYTVCGHKTDPLATTIPC